MVFSTERVTEFLALLCALPCSWSYQKPRECGCVAWTTGQVFLGKMGASSDKHFQDIQKANWMNWYLHHSGLSNGPPMPGNIVYEMLCSCDRTFNVSNWHKTAAVQLVLGNNGGEAHAEQRLPLDGLWSKVA